MTSIVEYLQVYQTPGLEELYCCHCKNVNINERNCHRKLYSLTCFLWSQAWILPANVAMSRASRLHSPCPGLRQRRFCSSCSGGSWPPWGSCSSSSPRWRCCGHRLRLQQLFSSMKMKMILNFVVKGILKKHLSLKIGHVEF